MTAGASAAGAASHAEEGWHSINWRSAYRIGCRLPARIVKAIQAGRWGKAKALQDRLTRSFSGTALAVRRVTENQGQATPGGDREIWDTPEKKAAALQALPPRGYQPQPLRRLYIPKVMARCALSASPRGAIEPCKHDTGWPAIPSRRRPPTRTPMDSGRNG